MKNYIVCQTKENLVSIMNDDSCNTGSKNYDVII